MDLSYLLYFSAAVLVLTGAYFVTRTRATTKDERKKIPETYFGAIRVTDQQGRNMLIVPKEDGSFEMVEEEKVKQ